MKGCGISIVLGNVGVLGRCAGGDEYGNHGRKGLCERRLITVGDTGLLEEGCSRRLKTDRVGGEDGERYSVCLGNDFWGERQFGCREGWSKTKDIFGLVKNTVTRDDVERVDNAEHHL